MRVPIPLALIALFAAGPGLAQIEYHPAQVGSTAGRAAPKAKKRVPWNPAPKMAARLASPVPLFGWSLRPPKGYVFTQKSEGTTQIFIFQGTPRPNGTSPVEWVILGESRPAENGERQDEMVADMYMIQLHKNRDNWKASPLEYGTLQGRKFVRKRWTATERVAGGVQRLRGGLYLTVFGPKFAAVIYQDADPGAKSTIDLLDASAQTLRKR